MSDRALVAAIRARTDAASAARLMSVRFAEDSIVPIAGSVTRRWRSLVLIHPERPQVFLATSSYR
jgi:hypothetical protein